MGKQGIDLCDEVELYERREMRNVYVLQNGEKKGKYRLGNRFFKVGFQLRVYETGDSQEIS